MIRKIIVLVGLLLLLSKSVFASIIMQLGDIAKYELNYTKLGLSEGTWIVLDFSNVSFVEPDLSNVKVECLDCSYYLADNYQLLINDSVVIYVTLEKNYTKQQITKDFVLNNFQETLIEYNDFTTWTWGTYSDGKCSWSAGEIQTYEYTYSSQYYNVSYHFEVKSDTNNNYCAYVYVGQCSTTGTTRSVFGLRYVYDCSQLTELSSSDYSGYYALYIQYKSLTITPNIDYAKYIISVTYAQYIYFKCGASSIALSSGDMITVYKIGNSYIAYINANEYDCGTTPPFFETSQTSSNKYLKLDNFYFYEYKLNTQTVYLNLSDFELLAKNYRIYLVDEKSGDLLSNLQNVSLTLTDYANNTDYLKNITNPFEFWTNATDFSIIVEYSLQDGSKIQRAIDANLLNNDKIRICVAPDDEQHYEQAFISVSQSSNAIVKNIFANCYVLAEYTRYAYQDAYIIKTYTIKATYNLYTKKQDGTVYLAAIDGSVTSLINLDFLQQYKASKPLVMFNPIDLSISKYDNNTLIIYFVNWKQDSTKTIIEIYDSDGNKLFSEEIANPNNATIYFDTSTLNYSASELFKVVAITTLQDGSTKKIEKYFNLSGSSGRINPYIAIIVAIMILLFSFTLFAVSRVFTLFGLLGIVLGFIVLALAPQTELIMFLYGILAIVGFYIGITFITEYKDVIR